MPQQLVDQAVANVLRIKYRLGLFDNPYPPQDDNKVALSDDNKKLAKNLAAESFVLLKNKDQLLPISEKIRSIALIGPLANSPWDQLGCWVKNGKEEDSITPLESFRNSSKQNFELIYEPGMPHARSMDKTQIVKAVQLVFSVV